MKIVGLFIISLLIVSIEAKDVHSNMAEEMVTAELQGSPGNQGKQLDILIKKLEDIGYTTVASNKNIQVHYYNKFGEKNVEMLSFFGLVNKEKLRPLLLSNPDFGAYAPFNFLAYKTLDTKQDNYTWYGHLATDTMLDIIGAKKQSNKVAFKEMLGKLDAVVNKQMTPAESKKFIHTKLLPAHGLTKLVKKFQKTDDLESFIEDFISEHDGRFSKHEFMFAGFIDFKFEYKDMDLDFEKYDAYWVSQLCHFKFSNSIFNRGMPEAGMFAPCSVYFYIPKGSNELHVGYASVDNWVNALNFKDQKRIDYMRSIDAEVVEILEGMGFIKENAIASEKVNTPITAQKKENSSELEALKLELAKTKAALMALKKETVKKNKEVPPVDPLVKKEAAEKEAIEDNKAIEKEVSKEIALPEKKFITELVDITKPLPKILSAYYAAQPQTVEKVREKLKNNGFTILAQTEVLKGHTVLSVTNQQLQNTNTFLAVLNMHINPKNEIRIQNPSYFAKAYLREKFKQGEFQETLKALQNVLGKMYMVKDVYEANELADFQFMMGMPHFDDMLEIAEGENSLSKLEDKKASKYIAYTLKLPNGETLVGHKLRNKTNKFLHKINAERNTNLLPYQSIIKKDKVVILDPKYYLALALPLLSMSDFMKIAATPDEIVKDIKRVYK